MSVRGFGVGSALVLGLLVMTLGLSLAAASTTHLQVLSTGESQSVCEDAAQSVVAMACERVTREPGFKGSLEFQGARLSFDPVQAQRWGIPVSINNYGQSGSLTTPSKLLIARDSFYLVGRCEQRGQSRTVEAIYNVPPFPYAIAAEQSINGINGLLVGSVESGAESSLGALLPSHLASNSSDPKAVQLGPQSLVKGDVQACGQIELDPHAVVEGQLKPGHSRLTLPKYPLRDFDPQAKGFTSQSLPANFAGSMNVNGATRGSGPCRIQGDLKLDGGILYVDGDLTIDGNLSGQGAVVTTGALHVGHQTRFGAQDGMAILTGGLLDIQGQNRESSQIRGMIYSEGGLRASQVSLWGGLVAGKGEVQLDNCAVVESQALQEVKVDIRQTTQTSTTTIYLAPGGSSSGQYEMTATRPPSPPFMAVQLHIENGQYHAYMVGKYDTTPETIGSFSAFRVSAPTLLGLIANFNHEVAVRVGGNGSGIYCNLTESGLAGFYGGTPNNQPTIGTVNTHSHLYDFSPSQFLSLRDRASLVLWKEN